MIIRRLFWVAAVLLLASCDSNPVAGDRLIPSDENEHLRVLFIGNSHTYVNDVPGMVGLLAESMGDTLTHRMSAPGGYDFDRHRSLDETVAAIQAEAWDAIVLQENGWRVALPPAMIDTAVYAPADDLRAMIQSAHPEARLVLYMTQGYADGVNTVDADWCREDPAVCSYEGMQNRIRDTYLHLADQLDAQVAPAGILWKILLDRKDDLVLHDEDGVHANRTGAYVSACVIYCTLFRKRLVDAYRPADVPPETASLIQSTVSAVLFDGMPDWKNE